MSRMISLGVLVGIILVVGFLFYQVMIDFLVPLFLALLIVVLFRPVFEWILIRTKNRQRVSAALTTALVTFVVLAPVCWVVTLAAVEGLAFISRFDVATTRDQLSKARQRLGLEIPASEEFERISEGLKAQLQATITGESPTDQKALAATLLSRVDVIESKIATEENQPSTALLRGAIKRIGETKSGELENEDAVQAALQELRSFKQAILGGPYRTWVAELANPSPEQLREMSSGFFAELQKSVVARTGATAAAALKFLIGLIIMIVAVYFFFADGSKMMRSVMRLLPLDDRYEMELLREFDNVSRAVVLATLLSAVAQGILAGIGFYFAGVPSVFLLTLVTTLLAMVPFVGAAAVWAPVAAWLYLYEERTVAAIALAIYGASIISTIDNVIKPIVLHGGSRLHPLLALLSVLGGVKALGPIGILIGPMIVVFLQTLLKILHRELTSIDRMRAASLAELSSGTATVVKPPPDPTDSSNIVEGPL